MPSNNPAHKAGPQPDEDRAAQASPTFTVSDFAHSSRLSRTTIKYYEKVGILSDKDFDETTRRYSEQGARRLSCAIALRNIGIPIGEVADRLDREPFSPDNVDNYRSLISQRVARDEALLACLTRQSDLIRQSGTIRVERVDAYCLQLAPAGDAPDGGAAAQERQPPKDDLGYPISNYGGLFCGDDPLAPSALAHGRAVAREHIGVVDGFSADNRTVGGTRCLVARLHLPNYSFEQLDWRRLFAPIREKAASLRLKAAGPAFVPYCAPMLSGDVYLPVCVPVRRRGLFEV